MLLEKEDQIKAQIPNYSYTPYSYGLEIPIKLMKMISMKSSLIHTQHPGTGSWFRIFLFLPLFFSTAPVCAQSMRTISTKDGLPQSFVSGIAQDDTSFVWIGTRNGLVRFDGIQYKIFQHRNNDTSSLSSNLIIWLRRDENNMLWIEHESGVIDKMDPVKETIVHYMKGGVDHPVDAEFIRRGWMVDHEGVFWGIRKGAGINTFEPQHKTKEIFSRANAGFASDTVRGVTETFDHEVWVLTQGGLSRFDKKEKRFYNFTNPYKEDYGNFPNSDAIAIDLYERKNGELMWGDRKSIFFFNRSTHRFKKLDLPAVSYLGVRWIRNGPDGSDYLESFGTIFNYNDSSGLTTVGKTVENSFGDAKSFLADRSGLLWIGTNAQGVKQIDLNIPYFKSFVYKKEFISDVLQDLWHTNMSSLFDWTPDDNLFISPSYQFRSVYDASRRIYFSLKRTVCYYDSNQKKFIKLLQIPMGTRITGLALTPQGFPMVIGTNGNIFLYDASKTWKPFLDTGLLQKTFGVAMHPLDIFVDEKNIWITTDKFGLLKIDIATKQIRQFQKSKPTDSIPANELLGICADSRNPELLWIGSYEGLICFNKTTFHSDLFSLKEGLPDNTIYSILPDSKGNLWLSTNKGICRFDESTHHVRIFKSQHGLPGDEFNRFHHILYPDGRLIFGSTAGWTIFDPLMVKTDEFDPQLALTELKVNNKEVIESIKSPILKSPLNANSVLTFPYDQNTISIGFAGLEFSQPQELRYRYRLSGYDNDWVQAGNSHQAIYTKIPPGHYTLFVNASNTSGKWSKHIKEIQLQINSPWWATTMAYLCYTIILAGLVWTFIRFRVSRMVMKKEMALKEMEAHQLRELDDMKSRFFSNITHEFRTPLTLIMGPAEQLKMENANNARINKMSDGIIYNSKQLLNLVNRLMELAKLESRSAKLLEQRGSPTNVAGLVVQSFETDAKARQIHLSFNDNMIPHDCWFYADPLERIVYNLVSNALKFTEPDGKVEVSLSADEENLLLTVKDTGIGIPENKLPYIFDRFYQVSENAAHVEHTTDRGTGIGLAMVKELINQMHGDIKVESRTGVSSGTSFIVTMPFRVSTEKIEMQNNDVEETDTSEQVEASDKKIQVLVVEDSTELAAFIISILPEQYEVKHALNGALGLEETLATMPDLIISDVMMPVMDGFEFCRRVKKDIRTSHIPIILLTAKAAQEDMITGLTEGANDYLAKPFHPTELLLRVHNLLESQQKLRERVRQELSVPGFPTIPQQAPVQDIFLTKLYELLEEHLDDSYFGVDQLLDLVNMSRSSLHRKLKSITSLSTTEVVRNFRLSKAADFLRQGFNSSDAAYKSGFGSPAYFTKCFREVYGLTPSDFIQKLRNNTQTD